MSIRLFKNVVILIAISSITVFTQNSQWQVFTSSDIGISETSITSITEDNNGKMWVGTKEFGLLKYDNGIWTKYDTTNSPLPVNNIWTIKVDAQNNKWIGTFGAKGGLVKYNDSNWTVYNLEDYGIWRNSIFDIEFDSSGNLWMGSYWDGLIKFDGTNFEIFNNSTSGLDDSMEEINCLEIDKSGQIWIGSDFGGAARFDGVSEWTHYFASDSTVDGAVYTLDIDEDENIWFGGVQLLSKYNSTEGWTKYNYPTNTSWAFSSVLESNNKLWVSLFFGGFYKFENQNWTHLYPTTPNLSEENSKACFMDKNENIWIGYENGSVAIYNENGIVSINGEQEKFTLPQEYALNQNYPNPFNPTTLISYQLPQNSFVNLIVYNSLGQQVTSLVNQYQSSGRSSVKLNAANLPSGVYIYKLQAGEFTSTKKMLLTK